LQLLLLDGAGADGLGNEEACYDTKHEHERCNSCDYGGLAEPLRLDHV
jgi:hypothetical protein